MHPAIRDVPDDQRIPVILCIDVEPDDFFLDPANPQPWSGFEFCQGYFRAFRERFEAATGRPVRFNWFLRMDPQVALAYGSALWPVERYGKILEEFRHAGDELGLHVHTYRWCDERGGWLDDVDNPEWMAHCLESSDAAFRQAFGARPQSLRFGNFWVRTEMINYAEKLGFRYELTVEPGLDATKAGVDSRKPDVAGEMPNYYRVPRQPYTPSRSDFTRRETGDARSITLIPMTSAYQRFGWNVRGIRHALGAFWRHGLSGHRQYQPLSMWKWWDERNNFSVMLDRALAVQKRPYLAFALRSDINGGWFKAYDGCLNALLNHRAAARFDFCTPQQAMQAVS